VRSAEHPRRPRAAALYALALVLLGSVLLAAPSIAGAVGELTYDQCFGTKEGCVNAAGGELSSSAGVAVSPDGSSVYATGVDSVVHFLADPASGKLTYESCLADTANVSCGGDESPAKPLREPFGLAVDPGHSAVFVAGAVVGDAVQLATLPSGALQYRGCVSDSGTGEACGKTKREVLTGASSVAVSPDGDALYVSATGHNPFEGSISHFSVAPEGQITFQGCVTSDGFSGGIGGLCGSAGGTNLLSDTTDIAVGSKDKSLYSVGGNGVVSHYSIDPPSRQFTWLDCVSNTGSSGACEDVPGSAEPLKEPEQVAISPDESSVYVSSSETISHFVADASGKLKWEGCVSSRAAAECAQTLPAGLLVNAEGIAVSPDGRSVYLAGSSAIISFTVGPGGHLVFQSCLSDEAAAGCSVLPGSPIDFGESVAVSPNGASLYLAGGRALLHFFRTLPAAPSGPGGSTTGPGSSPGGQTPNGQPASAAAIRSGLLAQITPKGRGAKIASLTHKKQYPLSFKALTAGVLTISWYFLPPGAHLSASSETKTKAKPVLLASGHVTFTAAGTKTVTIKLAHAGRTMLRHRHRLKLTAKGAFALPHGATITALKAFTLTG
jgi:DNA-binding beta-propeller fold protein YncE